MTGTNLHSIWDGLLAERAISTPPGGAAGILASIPPDQWTSVSTARIASLQELAEAAAEAERAA